MATKLTQEQFLYRVKTKGDPNVDLSYFIYINKRTKGNCLCKLCGNKWMALADSVLSGKGCNLCGYKESANKKILNKEDLPDGYTETSSLSDLEHIIRIYEEFGGVRIKSKGEI